MFGSSLEKTVAPHLRSDEELLAVVLAQSKGANAAMLARGVAGSAVAAVVEHRGEASRRATEAAASGIGTSLAFSMIVAVTDQRLLLFRSGGTFKPQAKELLGNVSILQVDAIEVAAGKLTKALRIVIEGARLDIETARAQPAESLVRALDIAHARAAHAVSLSVPTASASAAATAAA